jgi:hypothetical protein
VKRKRKEKDEKEGKNFHWVEVPFTTSRVLTSTCLNNRVFFKGVSEGTEKYKGKKVAVLYVFNPKL